MSEENKNTPVPIGVSDEENKKRTESNAATIFETIRKSEREKHEAEMFEALKLLTETDRSKVPEIYKNPAEHRGVATLRSPTEPLYRRMSEDVREWRNPDSDHYMAEWMRGESKRDYSRMLEANARLDAMFGRADMTEGIAPGTGAFATGTGAEYVPRPLMAAVQIERDKVAKMRRFATIVQMTAQEHSIPTQAAMTAAMVAEDDAEVAQGEGAVAHVALVAHTAGVQIRASKMLLDDAAINLVSIITQRGGSALGVLEDVQMFDSTAGDGTSPNLTAISGTSYQASLTTATTLSYTNLQGLYYDLPQQYRDRAVWFCASDVLGLLSNVRDGIGRPIYQGIVDAPGQLGDDPGAMGTLLRKPIYETVMPAGSIILVDPSQYYIGQRAGITVESSADQLFSTRMMIWLITERVAGNNTDLGAGQFLDAIAYANSL